MRVLRERRQAVVLERLRLRVVDVEHGRGGCAERVLRPAVVRAPLLAADLHHLLASSVGKTKTVVSYKDFNNVSVFRFF